MEYDSYRRVTAIATEVDPNQPHEFTRTTTINACSCAIPG